MGIDRRALGGGLPRSQRVQVLAQDTLEEHACRVSILDKADGELVLPTSVARSELTKILAAFRDRGAAAGPVLFGNQRKPEAAVVPYELIRLLDPIIEDLVIAARVQERWLRTTGSASRMRRSSPRWVGRRGPLRSCLFLRARPSII